MQKKIIILFNKPKGNTGGEVYNMKLFSLLAKHCSQYTLNFVNTPKYRNGISIRKFFTPFIELRLLKSIKESDICFFNSTMAYRHFLLMLFASLLFPSKKRITIHHHYEYEIKKGFSRFAFKFFEVTFLKLSNLLIIPSPYIKEATQNLLPKKKIEYIELAFERNSYNVITDEYKKNNLLFVGTIEHRKGLHLLVESLEQLVKKHTNIIVNIVGKVVNCKYYNYLQQEIKKHKLEQNVIFHGRLPLNELQNLFATSHVFVFPSLLEGYGMVIMEAMSYGVPVVAFNNSAMPYTIKNDYNGLLAENLNVSDLSNKISSILSNDLLRQTLSNGAYSTFNTCRDFNTFETDVLEFAKNL